MSSHALEQMILDGIKGLPPESLEEITDFVYFVRKRMLEPESFAEQLRELSLRTDLKTLSRVEQSHLEKEFEGYEQRYPRE
jgi:hypothetical protein